MPNDGFLSMDAGRVEADIAKVNQALDIAGERAIQATTQALNEFANELLAEAQNRLHNRSGDLSASGTVTDARIEENAIVLDVGFNKEYAAQVDLGGVITPKKGRMLAIPLEPILTGRGVARFASPREEPDLQLVPLFGKLFLVKKKARKSGERRFGDFHWLLVPEVNQDGTAYLSDAVRERYGELQEKIVARIRQILGEAA